jgi:tryptophan-rich sensory protein
MRDMSHHRNPHHPHYEKNQDASVSSLFAIFLINLMTSFLNFLQYSSLRKFLFAIYFIGVVCLSVALILLIVFEPIDETFKDLKNKLNI